MRKQPSSRKGRLVPHMREQLNRGGRRKTRDGSSRTWRVRLGRRKTRDNNSRTWRVRAFRSSQRRRLRRTAMRISTTHHADQHARAMQIGRLGLGKIPSAPTRRDYELRSRGPAVLGAEALDNLVSDSRRSSSTTPPPHPSIDPMAEPSLSELAAMIKQLATNMESLQSKVQGLQQEHTDASSAGPRALVTGEHHNDRPPQF
ncbi:hypothetical protein GUJ93_ZPchr0008g13225 [Zizania palustris]|uniref:Uncharacterized protein n=1 Tax=Zizania palustris TaxID=103762 RepID=A0A8J5V5I7_ZIZPA|nr:hypothetical protein GUJ93_ZPchr0008g13225 [Zizania palustris]